jgi:peptidoglycan/xylan/chitin deacetylase (PgdA/CDA1 family)
MKSFIKSISYGATATILRPPLLSRLYAGKLAILTYHGVVEAPQPIPDPCMVPIGEFRRQIHFLREHYEVLPLDEAVTRCRANRLKRSALAITFDDGYQSNHDLALPVLEKLGLPATIYLATAFLDTDTTIWTGLLQHAFSVTRMERLDWRGRPWELDSPSSRAASLQAIRAMLKSMPQANLFETVAELMQSLTGSDGTTLHASSPYRMLDATSLQRLAKSDCIQLGAHTHRHYVLSRIAREMQQSEILVSKRKVESLTSRPCRAFAYPNGRPEDFTEETVAILEDCGFDSAVTTSAGLCSGTSFSPMRIPRLSVNGQSSFSQFKLGLFNIPGSLRSHQ